MSNDRYHWPRCDNVLYRGVRPCTCPEILKQMSAKLPDGVSFYYDSDHVVRVKNNGGANNEGD